MTDARRFQESSAFARRPAPDTGELVTLSLSVKNNFEVSDFSPGTSRGGLRE
jgi:hypothetical protein